MYYLLPVCYQELRYSDDRWCGGSLATSVAFWLWAWCSEKVAQVDLSTEESWMNTDEPPPDCLA